MKFTSSIVEVLILIFVAINAVVNVLNYLSNKKQKTKDKR